MPSAIDAGECGDIEAITQQLAIMIYSLSTNPRQRNKLYEP